MVKAFLLYELPWTVHTVDVPTGKHLHCRDWLNQAGQACQFQPEQFHMDRYTVIDKQMNSVHVRLPESTVYVLSGDL